MWGVGYWVWGMGHWVWGVYGMGIGCRVWGVGVTEVYMWGQLNHQQLYLMRHTVARYLSLVHRCMKSPRLTNTAPSIHGTSIHPPLASFTCVYKQTKTTEMIVHA